MKNSVNICFIGASKMWVSGLATDLMCVFEEPLEIRLIDIDLKSAELCAEWGRAASNMRGRKDKFIAFNDRKKALRGADAVLITISTGGLDAMEYDLAIPEKYGICSTVGDTSGPSGWSRSIRNIPVFAKFAEDFQNICPKAFIANYSNPLASLTATLQHCCGNPSIGLCHAYFETKDVIQKIFGLEDWSKIAVAIAGMNHFTWVTDFRIGNENGYELLRKKVGTGSLRDLIPVESLDDAGYSSGHELCVQLYDAFGYLPYPAHRHTCEFLSFTISGNPKLNFSKGKRKGKTKESIDYCNITRTSIEERRHGFGKRDEHILNMISGKIKMPDKSRETGAEMISAYLKNKPFTDAVNHLNIGQIPGLPVGACVETLGNIDGLGVHPHVVSNIPEYLLEIMRPQAVCQKWITEGVLKKDRNLLLQALYRDPQCASLKPHEIRKMAGELFEANRKFIKGKTTI